MGKRLKGRELFNPKLRQILSPEEIQVCREWVTELVYACGEYMGVISVRIPGYNPICAICDGHIPTKIFGIACFKEKPDSTPWNTECSVNVCLDRDACRLKAALKSEEP